MHWIKAYPFFRGHTHSFPFCLLSIPLPETLPKTAHAYSSLHSCTLQKTFNLGAELKIGPRTVPDLFLHAEKMKEISLLFAMKSLAMHKIKHSSTAAITAWIINYLGGNNADSHFAWLMTLCCVCTNASITAKSLFKVLWFWNSAESGRGHSCKCLECAHSFWLVDSTMQRKTKPSRNL